MTFIRKTGLIFFMLLISSAFAFAKVNPPHSLIKDILKTSAHPEKHYQKLTIYILHPMVKDRESIYEYKSDLKWNGDRCQRTIRSFKVVKGIKPKRRNDSVGKSLKLIYPPKSLKKLFEGGVFNWKKASSMKLDKKSYSGYTFTSMASGKNKTGRIYMNGGRVAAVSIGFPDEGISHKKGMKANAEVWYFRYIDGKPAISEIKTYKLQKKGAIPVIQYFNEKFSDF